MPRKINKRKAAQAAKRAAIAAEAAHKKRRLGTPRTTNYQKPMTTTMAMMLLSMRVIKGGDA